jgi:hypothetical protein
MTSSNYKMQKMTSDGTGSCLEIYVYCGKKFKLSTFEKKTELRTAVDKCAYTEYLASGMGPMGTQECNPIELR